MAKTKPATKTKVKPKKPAKEPPLLAALEGGFLCECGCGRIADARDWDTQAPISVICCFKRA